jgi:hypothetical protein
MGPDGEPFHEKRTILGRDAPMRVAPPVCNAVGGLQIVAMSDAELGLTFQNCFIPENNRHRNRN